MIVTEIPLTKKFTESEFRDLVEIYTSVLELDEGAVFRFTENLDAYIAVWRYEFTDKNGIWQCSDLSNSSDENLEWVVQQLLDLKEKI